MINIPKKLYGLFADLVTRFKDKLRRDQFFAAKVHLTVLYFVAGFFIFVVVGFFVDLSVKGSFYDVALHQTGQPVERVFAVVQSKLFRGRVVRLILSVVSGYFLIAYAMRPIRKSSDLQRNFVSTVSHQLRTPLAVMQNGLEVALRKKENLTDVKAIQILQDNLEETKRMADIINFLLDFSKFDAYKKSLMMQNVSLKQVAEDACKLLKIFAEKNKIQVLIQSAGAGVVHGNHIALRELVVNLLKNAILYTHSGGVVKIVITEKSGKVCLMIEDNGKGISKMDLARIFEPFYQGDSGRASTARGGVGLGLTIVKEIVHLHKASIKVDSVNGRGTVFTVCF